MSWSDLPGIEAGNPIQQQAAAWFVRLRADDVSECERQQWQAWFQQDPRHQQAYAELEVVWSSLGKFASLPEIRTGIVATGRRMPRRSRLPWIAAATLVMAIALGTWLALPEQAPPELVYSTGLRERHSVELADGTHVDLDADSALRVRYDTEQRVLFLDQGRAFFRVAKDSRPLRVIAHDNSVRALGTQFQMYRQRDRVDVALFEGLLELQSIKADDATPQRLTELRPGQQARMAGHHVAISEHPVQIGAIPDWVGGLLVFDDTPLAEAVAEFNRYNGQSIVLEDPDLAALRISGVFRRDANDGFVEALQQVYGVQSSRNAAGIYLLTEQQ